MKIPQRCKKYLPIVDALLAAGTITLIVMTGALMELNGRAADWLYQKSTGASPDIVVIGIDAQTFDKMGQFSSWGRRGIAQAIKNLNNNDPTARPAVIGVDILFTGENHLDPEGDRELVAAAAQYGNVVVGAEAAIDYSVFRLGLNPYEEVWPCDMPFRELAAFADYGNIWGPDDPDGMVRHDVLAVNIEGNQKLYSFGRVIYEKWCRHRGATPNDPPAVSKHGVFYLPFSSDNYGNGYNLLDLLAGRVDSSVYKDKIVLIGVMASGMGDEFRTALQRRTMYGVEIHANVIQAFQRGFFPRDADWRWELAFLFVVCTVAEYFFRQGKMKHIAPVWLILTFGWLGICHMAYWYGGIILHVLWIPVSVSFLFVGSITVNYMLAKADEIRVTSAFGRYFDPAVMRQLITGKSDALQLGGKMREVAVLFVDIRGFTTMSEELPPTAIVDILNRYLTLTTECIRRHHGTIDKFIGDCAMAFWNAPIPQPNPVLLACRAAVDMVRGGDELSREVYGRYGRKISFGIGIHWGSAVVGNIGSPIRMDYTAIGDTVNTAARLESKAAGGQILISRAVADILGPLADVTSLGDSIELKGKAAGFEILRLNGLTETEESS